ncbi:MAG: GspH/FimT family pseudopilin [Gammaproteobacteria bacterium]|nr:GspH/FimT family pseudopilin [Gammaproteobacteria bacterium]MDP2348926.1 GspH/FimT family pseudopilin [Gammaproteobacteria bacterium]
MTPTSAGNKGFTLLELMVVLAILAMGSMLVIPSLTGMNARTFGAQVREASALLNYARRTAVVTGQPVTASFQIDAAENVEQTAAQSARSRLGRDDVWTSRGVSVTYRDSTNQLTNVEEFIDITFFPEGGSTGGELILALEGRAASIFIDPFSGKVRTEFSND